ncbi:MAG: hypothetical protein IJ309_01640 [Clostridia bacterium]|nr:hypothetical protein [Clostridia bacterium]
MKFGTYPQSIKKDDVTIISGPDERGHYMGSDGFSYVEVKATPHEPKFKFSTGEPIIEGKSYYFKVEPINWKVLYSKNKRAFLLCENAIACHRFSEKTNNYESSEIRSWLNDTFLNTAFSKEEQERIIVTEVDNSVQSTGYKSNEFACQNTNDKIFLMCHADISKSKYGFNVYFCQDKNRQRITSDFARATGAYFSSEGDIYGNGYWWLRSPGDAKSFERVRVVFPNGISDYSYYYPNSDYGSVVPALWVNL